MQENSPFGRESNKAYLKRLRLTALRTSSSDVLAMVKAMKKKARLIYEADGGDIQED
jgi:hypothetical protein